MSIADILEKAADKLNEPGVWGDSLCADLAIVEQGSGTRLLRKAEKFFAKHIGGKSMVDIWNWNDAPGRTQAEVVAKLREAAAKAREPSWWRRCAKRNTPLTPITVKPRTLA